VVASAGRAHSTVEAIPVSESTRLSGVRDYLRVVRQQRLLIIPIALLFTGAALFYSARAEKVYRAQASMIFQEPSSPIDALGSGLGSRQTTQERAAIGADVVTRPDIVAAVQRKVKGPLNASVSAAAEAQSNLVVVRASASDPKRAAAVANLFALETQRVLRKQYRRQVAKQERAARPDMDRIKKLADPVVVAELLNQRARLSALRRLGEPVAIARRATVPGGAISPQPTRNTLLGLVAGLTLGLVAAFARDSLDRRVRGARDLTGAAPFPVLGRIQESALGKFKLSAGRKSGRRRRARTVQSALEDVRIVRANLAHIGEGTPSRVLVTSALPEEGKSTVAFSLAVANALAGKRTLLVECDLRRPVLAKRLELDDGPGLTTYLDGHAEVGDIVRAAQLPGAPSLNGDEAGRPTLACVTAGAPSGRPAELLGSARFADFLAAVGYTYDAVVLDSSPVLPVADAIQLVPHADRVVLCARSRQTTRDQLKAASEVITRAGSMAVGIVVTGVRRGDEEDYGYYQSGYGEREVELIAGA
jgi:capsular exopolysaccharide synthesis family protein